MIYLKLFLIFLEIGAVSFGGGYGMISIIREKFLPLAGSVRTNLWTLLPYLSPPWTTCSEYGDLCWLIAGWLHRRIDSHSWRCVAFVRDNIHHSFDHERFAEILRVKAMLSGIRPCVVAMILATGITMALSSLLNITTISSKPAFDYKALIIFLLIALADVLLLKLKKFKLSPITIIVSSAFLGIIFY